LRNGKDADVPILTEAKDEYAKLRQQICVPLAEFRLQGSFDCAKP
jgi:hypothetical protein